jgi:hypothetical protein
MRRKGSKFRSSLKKTRAMRRRVPKDLKPLFDHCVNLALDAHAKSEQPGRGYLALQAGRDLLHARRLAK